MIKNIISLLLALTLIACSISSVRSQDADASGKNKLGIKEEIELIVRNLIRNIYEKEYSEIIALIPPEGIIDADTVISKDKIASDLHNSNSWLHKNLYKDVTGQEIEHCLGERLKGELYVSPYSFYKTYGDNYHVGITNSTVDDNNSKYTITVIGGVLSKAKQCKYRLWYLFVKDVGNRKYMLNSYLFQ